MKRAYQIYAGIAAAILTIILLASNAGSNKANDPAYSSSIDERILPQLIRPVKLKEQYTFAGEELPMRNFDARERLERELLVNSYWHSSTALNIKSSYRHFPVMEPILAQYGVPEDFKYLAVAESSLRNATSPAGAKGVWQFMKPVATHYGLEVSDEVDERFHLEKATEAACKLLLDLKKRFGSWTLAAAAYNMGGTRLARDIENQRTENYYDLNLNEETGRYVFRILAIKEILNSPQDFGFYLTEKDGYPPLDDFAIVKVNSSVSNWGDFAAKYDMSYRMLKVFNPWLISHKLSNRSGKMYEVKVLAR